MTDVCNVWRNSPTDPLKTFQLKSVTYGGDDIDEVQSIRIKVESTLALTHMLLRKCRSNIGVADPNASEVAYGARSHVRSDDHSGNIQVRLLLSKEVPLKPTEIPRLELYGALVGACLYAKIVGSLRVQIRQVSFWTDFHYCLSCSTICLATEFTEFTLSRPARRAGRGNGGGSFCSCRDRAATDNSLCCTPASKSESESEARPENRTKIKIMVDSVVDIKDERSHLISSWTELRPKTSSNDRHPPGAVARAHVTDRRMRENGRQPRGRLCNISTRALTQTTEASFRNSTHDIRDHARTYPLASLRMLRSELKSGQERRMEPKSKYDGYMTGIGTKTQPQKSRMKQIDTEHTKG
ncbi:hypothetical protein EVAR_70434_1 [Eumeta japonica]|uniref:Uncharacterized protein n=1 Tax=Eumeta variegata TaxID=151549 RepID=A0A4C1T577_EUMVA|nr:hypothetical protein EVAR_70434_1 [Eumeta japonica]